MRITVPKLRYISNTTTTLEFKDWRCQRRPREAPTVEGKGDLREGDKFEFVDIGLESTGFKSQGSKEDDVIDAARDVMDAVRDVIPVACEALPSKMLLLLWLRSIPCFNATAATREALLIEVKKSTLVFPFSSIKKEDVPPVRLQRSHSETDAMTIMKAVQRVLSGTGFNRRFSRPYILPLLVKDRNQDVKAVSPKTVCDLIDGQYDDQIHSFEIIDCRYPYEYDGGHIKDARNIYTKETVLKEFLPNDTLPATKVSEKRRVIIFHCEFSSERAPNMYRFLRNKDRNCNNKCYPNLHHPELYILRGGYKAFFKEFKEYCVPREYKPMVHKDHEDDLKHFRAKSKSWNGESKSRMVVRPGLKF
ncbi:M-phase inducer phosphatase [Nymphon striatum]|nr:M-phase inducer phosphatase [Nymphon striatum]